MEIMPMARAFFEGKKELFKGLDVYNLEEEWSSHPIFHIDLGPEDYQSKENLVSRLNLYLSE